MKETIKIILIYIIIFTILFLIMFAITKADKKRCEKNGGTYIWEMSYGNKCHLESKGE